MKRSLQSGFVFSWSLSLLILLTVLGPNKALGEGFNVNLQPRLGYVRNQSDTGICFAHAAADAMSLILNERVGALSVMVQYFANREGLESMVMTPLYNGIPKTFQAGLASRTLKAAAESVLCSAQVEEVDEYYDREDFSNLIASYSRYRATVSPTRPKEAIQKVVLSVQKLFPGIDAQVIEGKLSPFQPLSLFLSEMLNEHCRLSAQGVGFTVVGDELEFPSSERVLDVINEALDREMVAVIHYNPKFLMNMSSFFWENKIGFHVSSIVGRHRVDEQVFYLLRNTWGDGCGYAEPYGSRCHQGHIWISEEDVRLHVTSAAYLRLEER